MLKNHIQHKKLLAYSAAAGIALAGGVALAETNEINTVQVQDIADVTLTPGDNQEVLINFDGDANTEGKIVLNNASILQIHSSNNGGDRLSYYFKKSFNVNAYQPGEMISHGNANVQTSFVSYAPASFPLVRIDSLNEHSLGVKVQLDGQSHWGWIRFSSTTNSVTIEGYGYQDNPSATFITAPGGPLAATLANFAAIADGTDVSVTWSTVSEQDNLGFNLYRSSDLADLGTQLNAELIPAQAPGSGQGSTYEYLDENLEAGTYFYTLEDVDTNGTPTRHEPVSATIGQTTAVALNQFEGSDEGSPLGLLMAGGALAAVAVAARRRRS